MKFLALALTAASFAFPAFSQLQTTSLTYSNDYDNANLSLNSVVCSGPNILTDTGYTTLGDIPTFPNVGGVFTVTGYGSSECGTCYEVTYPKTNKTIYALAVDYAKDGFFLSEEAMNYLTDKNAVQLGKVQVTWERVDPTYCGLAPAA